MNLPNSLEELFAKSQEIDLEEKIALWSVIANIIGFLLEVNPESKAQIELNLLQFENVIYDRVIQYVYLLPIDKQMGYLKDLGLNVVEPDKKEVN